MKIRISLSPFPFPLFSLFLFLLLYSNRIKPDWVGNLERLGSGFGGPGVADREQNARQRLSEIGKLGNEKHGDIHFTFGRVRSGWVRLGRFGFGFRFGLSGAKNRGIGIKDWVFFVFVFVFVVVFVKLGGFFW